MNYKHFDIDAGSWWKGGFAGAVRSYLEALRQQYAQSGVGWLPLS